MRTFDSAQLKFIECAADFPAREDEMLDLLSEGMDINACNVDENDLEKTLLSECIKAYQGEDLPKLVGFFLDHGHDLAREGKLFGTVALLALIQAKPVPALLEAAKKLLRAGADVSLHLNGETILQEFGLKSNLVYYMDDDLAVMSLWSALYDILRAAQKGEDFEGFYAMDAVVGKSVNGIYSRDPDESFLCMEQHGERVLTGELILQCEDQFLFIDACAGTVVWTDLNEDLEWNAKSLELFGYPKKKSLVIESLYYTPAIYERKDAQRAGLYLKPKDGEVIFISQN